MGQIGERDHNVKPRQGRIALVATIDFTGEFDHRIDDRGRLAIPAAYRGLFEFGGYLLPGPDGQLELYTQEGYAEEKRVRTVSDRLRPAARRLARSFFGRARRVELDRQGRIVIPAPLRQERGLDGPVSVVGMGDYLEVWNTDAWLTEQSVIDQEHAELLEGLADIRALDAANHGAESSA